MSQAPYRVLSIGHSYTVAANRDIMRALAHHHPQYNLTIASPDFIHGSLRTLQADIEERAPYRHVTLPVLFSRKIHLMVYQNLASLIKVGQFDLVHIWEEPYIVAGFQIARACQKAKVPYFFRTAQSLNKKYLPPFSFFEKYTVENASAWNAGASLVFKNLIERGYEKEKGVVISLGTDKDRFYQDLERGADIKRQLGLSGVVIGFSGRLVEAKGLRVLMKALENLETERPGTWSFLALGSGPMEKTLLDWAKEMSLSSRVKVLLAHHEDMPHYMQAMDMLVAPSQTTPSWREQFGRMITEAFATKVAVIGSNSGEIPFVIDEAGLIADEGSPEQWTHAMIRLIDDPDLRKSLSLKGYDRFLQHYEVRALAQKYADLSARLLRSAAIEKPRLL